ncbi:MAG TPA: VOC family protein [Hanamia sp.]|nr:VOC family protein [Hanamia sp.]
MAKMNSYLNFNGNTEEAFNFYKSVFGGEFLTLMRFKDTPDADKMPADEQEKVMHVALPIGDNILMGTDVLKSMEPVNFGTNSSLSIDGESEEEANQLFNKLSVGGKVVMPLEKMFWGALFGMITDKFGVQWMVNYDFKERNTVL